MLRKFIIILVSVICVTGCTNQSSSQEDTALSQAEIETIQLVSSLDMDGLVKVKERVVLGMVFAGDKDVLKDACMYRSNTDGNYDMVAVIYPNDMDTCLNYIHDYLDSLKSECNKNYPQEVFKISNAVEKHDDKKIILVISSDIEAARVQVENILEDQ